MSCPLSPSVTFGCFLFLTMPKESSKDRRLRLSAKVAFSGVVMPTPCSECRKRGSKCLVDLSSGRCADCVAKNRKCDLVVSERDYKSSSALSSSAHYSGSSGAG